HPEWLMVPSALASALHDVDPQSPEYVAALARWTRSMSSQVEGLYLSPISEESQAYTTRVVTEIAAKYAVDGIHLDYVRYPTEGFDYSRGAIAAFRALHAPATPAAERQRLDARSVTEPTLWTSFLPEGWELYRRDRLTALATRLAGAVRRARPRALVTIAVAPSADEALSRRLQNWRAWAAAGDFDAICPMAYAVDPRDFENQLAQARAAAASAPLWVGVGAYQLPVATTAERLRLARRAGATGVLLFSYEALAPTPGPSAYFTALRPVLLEPPAGISR
ncbi:MAG: family 10 glycosylhydrolase, partial [Vicinamibacterales bacterium]